MSSNNVKALDGERQASAESDNTFDEYRGSVIAGATSIDGVTNNQIVPLTYYANYISNVADGFLIQSRKSERDKMHVLRVEQARDYLEANYPLLLRKVGASSAEARILQEIVWSAFLIGLVSDRIGYQLYEANIKLQEYRSSKGNLVKSSKKDENDKSISEILPLIIDILFDLGEIKTVSSVFYNNKRLVESAEKHNLIPKDLEKIFTASRVKRVVGRLLVAGVLRRRPKEK